MSKARMTFQSEANRPAWRAVAACAFAACALACALLCGGGHAAFAVEGETSASSEAAAVQADASGEAAATETGTAQAEPSEESRDQAAEKPAVEAEGRTSEGAEIVAEVADEATGESADEAPAEEQPASASAVDEDPANIVDPTQRADNSFIYDTTLESLFEESTLYDGRIVQIEGEVIGDLISDERNPNRCWITLTAVDEEVPSTISVLMSRELANQIDHFGKYGVKGTTLQVRGVYNQACSEHDGLADVHATNASVIALGEEHPDEFNLNDFLPGIAAVAIGLILMGAFYFARERTR